MVAKIAECQIHKDACPHRRTVAHRRAYANQLRSWGVDPKEWDDDGWDPDYCVEMEHRKVQAEIIRGVDWDEERWNKMHPGVPYRGIAADLACKEGRKVWGDRYVRDPKTGVEGPVFRNKREREEYCKLTGHRMLEPNEQLGNKPDWTVQTANELGQRFAEYVRRGFK